MILLMVLLGAFYPAIDVTAGERERGTLETVLAAPIAPPRSAAGQGAGGDRPGQRLGVAEPGLDEPDPGPGGATWPRPTPICPSPGPRAAATGWWCCPRPSCWPRLFVAVGSLARGFKEAQNFLMPVYFLFFAPAMLGALGEMPLTRRAGAGAGPERQPAGAGHRPGQGRWAITRAGAGLDRWPGAWWRWSWRRGSTSRNGSWRWATGDRDSAASRRREPAAGASPATRRPPSGEALALFAIAFLLLYFVFMPLQRLALVRGLLISQWLGMFGLAVLLRAADAAAVPRRWSAFGRRAGAGLAGRGADGAGRLGGGQPGRPVGAAAAQGVRSRHSASCCSPRLPRGLACQPVPVRRHPGGLRGGAVPRGDPARAADPAAPGGRHRPARG